MSIGDRAGELELHSNLFTGIDFIHVVDRCVQSRLRIYFVTDARLLDVPFTGAAGLLPESFAIESVTDPNLPRVVVSAVLTADGTPTGAQVQVDGDVPRTFIEIELDEETDADFGLYRLHIADPRADTNGPNDPFSRIDPFFNDIVFSFKAGCEDLQDCAPPPVECPDEPTVDFPVDYLARDFVSFRGALLDFASQRYPQWTLPIEADVGTMLAETMAALADELAYMQDRHAREAYLETASQRRSLRKKARLLDFEIHDGRSASTLLEVGFPTALSPLVLTAGMRVWAPSENLEPVPFEIGLGLFDRNDDGTLTTYTLKNEWSADELEPYWFDATRVCLPIGTTEIVVRSGSTPLDAEEIVARTMLLRTEPVDPSLPARSHFVVIKDAETIVDPLNSSALLTRIVFGPEQALPFQLDQTDLEISLNIVPATAGRTREQRFIRGTTFDEEFVPAVEREGPSRGNGSPRQPIVLLGLDESETQGVGYIGQALRAARPEVEVLEIDESGDPLPVKWTWVRSLLAADPTEPVFTLEDGVWRRIRAFRRAGEEFVHRDYATGSGFSVRFGDGEFGIVPGENRRFLVRYRTGPGVLANVPAKAVSLTSLEGQNEPAESRLPDGVTVSNPLPVTDGVNPELAAEIKQILADAYQAEPLFAVRPEDYAEQAERLDFVQRAQGTPRWTGSWQSMFVATDPFGSVRINGEQRRELDAWMDCVRQAGREVNVTDPQTVPIDIRMLICVEPFAFASQVARQVQEVLLGSGLAGRPKGFFHPDNLTFGVPLRRSALEAAVQAVPGVRSVREIFVRMRGLRRNAQVLALILPVGPNQVLRLDNNPLHPEAGTLTLETEGGA